MSGWGKRLRKIWPKLFLTQRLYVGMRKGVKSGQLRTNFLRNVLKEYIRNSQYLAKYA